MNTIRGINPHCLNKYSSNKPLIGNDDKRAFGVVEIAQNMGFIVPDNAKSPLGRYISSLEKRNEPGILWTHDKSRSSRGGYPVKAYRVTEQLLTAIQDYCNQHNFKL